MPTNKATIELLFTNNNATHELLAILVDHLETNLLPSYRDSGENELVEAGEDFVKYVGEMIEVAVLEKG